MTADMIPGMSKYMRILKSVVLILLFMESYVSATFFTHTHYDSRGCLIVRHSHPYSDSGHSHSENEIIWIDLFSSFNAEQADIQHYDFSAPFMYRVHYSVCRTEVLLDQVFSSLNSRAPPVA